MSSSKVIHVPLTKSRFLAVYKYHELSSRNPIIDVDGQLFQVASFIELIHPGKFWSSNDINIIQDACIFYHDELKNYLKSL